MTFGDMDWAHCATMIGRAPRACSQRARLQGPLRKMVARSEVRMSSDARQYLLSLLTDTDSNDSDSNDSYSSDSEASSSEELS